MLIAIGDSELLFIEHPLYSVAHPGEVPETPDERCTKCAIARRMDTNEDVLLWQAEEKNWTVSRADPQWERHRTELFPEGAVRNALRY